MTPAPREIRGGDSAPPVAVIGGSGFYSFLEDAQEVTPSTPYGETSGPVSVGSIEGRRVAFLARHGNGHAFAPHKINFRANIYALRSLGVRQIIAPCAVGGLQPYTQPGALVVPDQLVDRTTNRIQTYVESGAVHTPFADPYCPTMRRVLTDAAPGSRDGGAMVVIDGPRFSTRAESQWYAAQGWSLVNMTGHPEAVLAREMGICYATVALVTDLDAGVSAEEAVSQEKVFAMFEANIERLKVIIASAVVATPSPEECSCDTWMDGLSIPYEIPGR